MIQLTQRSNLHSVSALFLSLFLFTPKAQALDVSLIAPITYSGYSVAEGAPSTSSSNRLGGGVGVTLGLGLIPFFSFETGLLNITHSFVNSISVSSANITVNQSYTYNYWQVPFLIRFTPISQFSVQAGAYYSKASRVSTESSHPIVLQVNQPGLADDFGLLAGLGYRAKLSPFVKFRADLMYEYGLKKLPASVGTTLNTRSVDLWLGIMFDLI